MNPFNQKEEKIVLTLDGSLLVLSVSDSAGSFFGLPSQHLIGDVVPCFRALSPEKREMLLQQVNDSGKALVHTRMERNGSGMQDFLLELTPLFSKEKHVIGYSLTIEKVSSLDSNDQESLLEIDTLKGESFQRKRSFESIRHLILQCLIHGPYTINQISIKTGINWKTVENHLTYLLGRGQVKEVMKSEYVRIFDVTEEGKMRIMNLQQSIKKPQPEVQLFEMEEQP